jgi:rifampicin phosphotransferase
MRYGQGVNQLISLEDPRALDVGRVGAKAATLAQLRAEGVPVLPGCVVPADALSAVVAGIKAESGAAELCSAILHAVLPAELAGEIRTAAAKLGARLVVRSSAVDEDGEHASWAGQFETVLGARPGDETEAAVLRCLASAYNARSSAYGERRGRPSEVRMAVLIQPMIEPRCAGVMFTINPLSGSWREMTVEAAWGQAAPVVQGELVPDYYVVRRPRRAPRPLGRILAAVRLEVIEDEVRPQADMWVIGQSGLEVRPVAPVDVEAPKLRHFELNRLCRLGLRVEGLLGRPQDLEWALDDEGRFFVLQSRPVTTTRAVRRTGPALWTRRFIGERWTEPATPLGWSLVGGLLEEFVGYPDTQRMLLGGGEPTQLIRFAPYLNVTVFRHLAFKIPGAPPPQFMMELLPTDEQRGWRRRHAQAPDLKVYRSLIQETIRGRRWRHFAAGLFSNPRAWRDFEADLEVALPALSLPSSDVRTAMARADRCMALARRYIGIHVPSLLYANLLYQASVSALRAKGRDDLVRDALRPVEESWTVKTNHALWMLGRGDIDLQYFLADFGHRAGSSWELFSPRWRESPDTVAVLADAAAQHADPARLAADQARRATAAAGTLSGWIGRLVKRTQTYLLLRENQRFSFDRLLLAWGDQLKQIEKLSGVEVRFLLKDELEGMASGRISAAALAPRIGERKVAWAAECQRRAAGDEPPNFLAGAEAIEEGGIGVRLQGVGTSPGVVTGTVRVLRSLADGERLQTGEILVARATDPGWTPLFLKAGGVIMEIGGMLSHGAVVAREYGLPAVVNIAGATNRLEDGQVVTIDGRQGVVWLR